MEPLVQLFSAVCGQAPGHTWAPGGWWLPCCQRCTGLYAGALLAALLHLIFKPQVTGRFLGIHGAFLLLMVPFGFHWLPQGPNMRALTGLLFGFGIVTFLLLPWNGTRRLNRWRGWDAPDEATRNRRYYCGVLLGVLLVPLLGVRGGELAGLSLTFLVAGGAAVLGSLVLADTVVGMKVVAQSLFRLVQGRAEA